MSELSVVAEKSEAKAPPVQMIRFVCSHCNRQLVWAEATVSVNCPSCGRWIKANRFWQGTENKRKGKKPRVEPEQMELF